MSLLEGKKTFVGLAIILCGVLGFAKYITNVEIENSANLIVELIGIAIAVYGRIVAKPNK